MSADETHEELENLDVTEVQEPPSSIARRRRNARRASDDTRKDPSLLMRATAKGGDRPSLPHVEVGPTLGRGGMALVRLGQQLALDRSVAVKTLRDDRRTAADVERLLREARVTGRLEHPNIVPVHDIVRGDDGVPQVVLKLIEGSTWTVLMQDPERVREQFGADDMLLWNLGVVKAVCRALSFAHSRGVLHRDVKPSNVMVGRFGEVYLLDWGIAVEMDDLERDAHEISGTAAYMAPEQLTNDLDEFGPWTDTYLLGATLYQLLGGRPPFAGLSAEQRAENIDAKPEPLDDEVPLELRRIVDDALDPHTSSRTTSPEVLRASLESFLQHRSAIRLSERADRERERFVAARQNSDDVTAEEAALAAELAYRAALEEWPDCEDAVSGLRQLAGLRIERALEMGETQVALRVLESQGDVPAELRERVRKAAAHDAEEEARLRKIVIDSDRGLGHRARGITGAFFGLVWVAFWVVVAYFPPDTMMPMVVFSFSTTIIGVAIVRLLLPELLRNRINQTSMMLTATGTLSAGVWFLGAGWLGLSVSDGLIGFLLLSAVFASGMANLMDRWGTISAVGFTLAFLVACYEPDWLPHAMLAGNVVLILNQVILNFTLGRRGFERPPSVKVGRSGSD